MPRPSLKAERREEILDAYERCIARFGVEGATLERTADDAGLARALIRHNVGNKDDLLDAFIDRFLKKANDETALLFSSLPDKKRVATMIEWLFDPSYSDPHTVSVSAALITAANDRPDLARRMRTWTFDFIGRIEQELASSFRRADKETVNSVATGIASIYFNTDSLVSLGRMDKLHAASKNAAFLLVSILD